jgi:DNA polymerase III subunit delta
MVKLASAQLNIFNTMLIKYQGLNTVLNKSLHNLYVVTGQDPYLLNDAQRQIKTSISKQRAFEQKTIHLTSTADWSALLDEASNYSLFSEFVLIQAYFDKKSLDKNCKEIITTYLEHNNPKCQIIIYAPNVSSKQLQWLSNNKDALIVQIYPLRPPELLNWIQSQLKQQHILHDNKVPKLIHLYSQGNMLACAQAIEKLALIYTSNTPLTIEEVKETLIDQSEYQLYELAEACLNADTARSLRLVRQAHDSKTEPTLMLWLLTQEVRLLIQLHHLIDQQLAFNAACNQLNIWQQKMPLYRAAQQRLPIEKLHPLLQFCNQIDQIIKSNQNQFTWQFIEQLVLALSKNGEILSLDAFVV